MSRTLTLENYAAVQWKKRDYTRKSFAEEKSGKIPLGFVIFAAIVALGAFYLYQVNDIATKGYEIKEAENRIKEIEKESEKLQIKEVELKSMYNIEKSTENLNLVSSKDITYVVVNNSVAMK